MNFKENLNNINESWACYENMPPELDEIMKFSSNLEESVKPEHIKYVKGHFNTLWLKFSDNLEIVWACSDISNQCDYLLNLWCSRKSWEIMKAANDTNYWEKM